jgi:hypothetical protein
MGGLEVNGKIERSGMDVREERAQADVLFIWLHMILSGYGRIMMVPRVKLAYDNVRTLSFFSSLQTLYIPLTVVLPRPIDFFGKTESLCHHPP